MTNYKIEFEGKRIDEPFRETVELKADSKLNAVNKLLEYYNTTGMRVTKIISVKIYEPNKPVWE